MMEQRDITFYVCLDDGTENVFKDAAVVADGQVYIPFTPLIEHLGLNARKAREKRDDMGLPVAAWEIKRGRRAQAMACLLAADLQAFLGSLTLTKIKPIQKAHLVGHFVTGFVDAVMTQCVTKSEPVPNPASAEIHVDHALSAADQFRADLSKLVLQGRLRPAVVDLAATTDYPVVVRVRQPSIPPFLTPESPFYEGCMRRLAQGPEMRPLRGPRVETAPTGHEQNYRPNVFYYRRGEMFRGEIKTFAELAREQPEHPLVSRQDIDMFQWANEEQPDGTLRRIPNPNYLKPRKPYWE